MTNPTNRTSNSGAMPLNHSISENAGPQISQLLQARISQQFSSAQDYLKRFRNRQTDTLLETHAPRISQLIKNASTQPLLDPVIQKTGDILSQATLFLTKEQQAQAQREYLGLTSNPFFSMMIVFNSSYPLRVESATPQLKILEEPKDIDMNIDSIEEADDKAEIAGAVAKLIELDLFETALAAIDPLSCSNAKIDQRINILVSLAKQPGRLHEGLDLVGKEYQKTNNQRYIQTILEKIAVAVPSDIRNEVLQKITLDPITPEFKNFLAMEALKKKDFKNAISSFNQIEDQNKAHFLAEFIYEMAQNQAPKELTWSFLSYYLGLANIAQVDKASTCGNLAMCYVSIEDHDSAHEVSKLIPEDSRASLFYKRSVLLAIWNAWLDKEATEKTLESVRMNIHLFDTQSQFNNETTSTLLQNIFPIINKLHQAHSKKFKEFIHKNRDANWNEINSLSGQFNLLIELTNMLSNYGNKNSVEEQRIRLNSALEWADFLTTTTEYMLERYPNSKNKPVQILKNFLTHTQKLNEIIYKTELFIKNEMYPGDYTIIMNFFFRNEILTQEINKKHTARAEKNSNLLQKVSSK